MIHTVKGKKIEYKKMIRDMDEHNLTHITPLSIDKMAIVNRIEFCDAAKNSGVVLYARKILNSNEDYQPDLLDIAILNWIRSDYPDTICYTHKIVIEEDVDDIQRLVACLNKETRQIRVTNSIKIFYAILGEFFERDLEIYCYEANFRYPQSQINIQVQKRKDLEYYEKTYMTFSDYLTLLGKTI